MLPDFLDDLVAILNSAGTHPGESIICGNFNVHFGNTQSTAVLNLANLLHNAGFMQHVVAREWKYTQSGNYPSSFLDNSIICKINISSN